MKFGQRLWNERDIRRLKRRYSYMVILPAVYVGIAWGHWGVQRAELYPFAPWSMFNNVPNTVTRFTLVVESATDSSASAKPIWEYFPEGVKALPLNIYRSQARLGIAVESQQPDQVAAAQNILTDFLKNELGSGEAVLIKVTFDPAKMYIRGTLIESKDLLHLRY